jgi:lipopolysaccharide heptosyltransferase I
MIDSLNKNRSVLLIKPSSFGDVVHTFPVVSALKRAVPGIEIDWVVSEQYGDLVQMSPHVGEIFPFKRSQWAKWWRSGTISELGDFVSRVRERKYGLVLDLQGLLRSGLLTFLSRGNIKAGFKYAREGAPLMYGVKIPAIEEDAHAITRYMSALDAIGIKTDGQIAYDLVVPMREDLWADTVTPDEPFVAINPNTRWETKKWPTEKFAILSKRLYEERGLKTVIIGGPTDSETGSNMAKVAGACATDLTGQGGLVHLAAILKKSIGLITNDSGPMHLAVALGTPTVSIFGPTSPQMTGPFGPGHTVISSDLNCSPCFKRECPAKNNHCMVKTTVDSLINACGSLIAPAKV